MEVYDKGNPDRLLGYINKDIKVQYNPVVFDLRSNRLPVSFYFHPKWTDGEPTRMVLTTEDPLSELLDCPYFLLPNETPDIAANRRYLG